MSAVSWLLTGVLLLALPGLALAQGPMESASFVAERSVYEHAVAKAPAEITDTAEIEISLPENSESATTDAPRPTVAPSLAAMPANDQVFAPLDSTNEPEQDHDDATTEADAADEVPTRLSRSGSKLMPLKRPAKSDRASLPHSSQAMATVLVSLTVVLGVFFGVVWLMRRGMPAAASKLPTEVVEVLGRTTLFGKQQAHLIRCGNKLLLVSLSPGSVETITEITDPLEVDRIAGLCKQSDPNSSTVAFRQVFQQFSQEKPASGFLEPQEEAVAESIMALLRRGAGKSSPGGRGA